MAALEPAAAIEYGAVYALSPAARASTRDLIALRAALSGWDAKPTPPSSNLMFGVHNGRHETIRLYLLGLVNARIGDTVAATRYADSIAAVAGDSIHLMLAGNLSRAVRARVLYARGDLAGAIAQLEQRWIDPRTHRTYYSTIFAQDADRFFLAELLEKAGRYGESLAAYSSVGDYSTDGLIYMPTSHLRRGDIYLKLGDRERAAAHYARFVQLWKDCDPNLVPLRNAAQAKVAQLRRK
jgi:tetratricopeptide (TPR) repeat protein